MTFSIYFFRGATLFVPPSAGLGSPQAWLKPRTTKYSKTKGEFSRLYFYLSRLISTLIYFDLVSVLELVFSFLSSFIETPLSSFAFFL
jgi:hypothetical protein